MKKLFYFTLIIILFITSTGFRGCNFGWVFEFGRILFMIYDESIGDNPAEPFGISVGENGKISITNGRPPAPWVTITSGVTQNLNHAAIFKQIIGDGGNDSAISFVVGNSGTVLRSGDRGNTWVNLSISGFTKNLYGVSFLHFPGVNPHVIAVGDSGIVVKSTGSGSNWSWQQFPVNTTKKLTSVGVITNSIIIVAGEKGAIYRTSNSGQSWVNQSVPDTSANFKKVYISTHYPNFDRVWIAGDNGKIYASTNYGNNFFPQNSGTTKNLRDLSFRNSNEGIAAGDEGTVRHTTNGGNTWTADPYFNGLTTRNIICIAKVDSNTVNTVTSGGASDLSGQDSTFFLTVSSEPLIGIDPISSLIPKIFNLFQNYPNPFNPVTTIRFDIPSNGTNQTSDVKLVVFDILGKEIITLVNEKLTAGTYEKKFDGRDLTSGVYFYRIEISGDLSVSSPNEALQTGHSFTETKRLLLLK